MTRSGYIRGVLTAFAVYGLVFIVMLFSVMTDQSVPLFGRSMHFVLKYVCGFPLVLLNSELPFFLESRVFMWSSIPLTVINAVMQVWLVRKLRDLLRPLWQRFFGKPTPR